ncbi:unnamed protein product, partial [Penicillium nalgiovense]
LHSLKSHDSMVLDSVIHVNGLFSDTSLEIGARDYLATCDLSFGIEMARPESKGGVVVVLLQPHSSQDNSNGLLAGKRNCPTLNAVSELISAASNAKLGFDDVSVFDAIPFLNEKVTGEKIIENAQGVFADMIKAKQPEVVISCFKTEASNAIVQNLRSRRIGYCFEFDPRGSRQLAELGLSLTRVNALHPSYAINYFPEFSCFKRLLVLEFVKAFALWQGNWIDETWMVHLRHECHEQAKKLWKADDVHSRWKAHYLKGRWEDPLEALEAGFKECLFGEECFNLAKNCSYRLVESKITWICCDIAWILENQETVVLDIPRQLLLQFKSWCQKSWPGTKLQRNFDGCNGYYDHSALLPLKSKQQGAYGRKLENTFYTFLRDLNLSYSWSQCQTICNRSAQGDAFRRFAAAFESMLEEAQERTISRREHDLCDKISSMTLN